MRQKTILGIVGIVVVAVLVILAYLFSHKNFFPVSHDATKADQYATLILACYPKSPTGAEDTPIPNNSIQYVKETSRMFISMPKDLYPKDIQHAWITVTGNATAGYISNGGLPGEAEGAMPGCWSTYMDFEGNGEVDLRVQSVVKNVPDYFVRFIVSSR